MVGRIKKVMKLNKRFYKNQESRKGKGSSEGKKVECFNYGGLGHFPTNCPILKDFKKSI